MTYDLTGNKVSLTYKNLLQYRDGSFYDGAGNAVPIGDVSTAPSDVTKAYVDSSFALRDISIAYLSVKLNASINSLRIYNDGSISARDISIAYISGKLNASINSLRIYVDGSLSSRDSSISYLFNNSLTKSYVDSSINARDISINYLSGKLNSSINELKIYTDGSLLTRDGSITYLFHNKLDSSTAVSKIYVDGSLSSRDASISYLFGKLDSSGASAALDPSIDYETYTPRISDVSFYYDISGNVSSIISLSALGQKTTNFIYNTIGDVSSISINNYGFNQRNITFDTDIDGNILSVHIK